MVSNLAGLALGSLSQEFLREQVLVARIDVKIDNSAGSPRTSLKGDSDAKGYDSFCRRLDSNETWQRLQKAFDCSTKCAFVDP